MAVQLRIGRGRPRRRSGPVAARTVGACGSTPGRLHRRSSSAGPPIGEALREASLELAHGMAGLLKPMADGPDQGTGGWHDVAAETPGGSTGCSAPSRKLGPSGRAHREVEIEALTGPRPRNASWRATAGSGIPASGTGGDGSSSHPAGWRTWIVPSDGVRCDTRPRGRGDDGTGRADRGSRVSSSRRQPNARHGGRRPSACGCSRGSGIPRHAG